MQGLSGSGKTTLAAEWAITRQRTGDAVWWFNAADIADPAMITDTIRSSHPSADGIRIVIVDDAHYLTDRAIQSTLIEQLAQTVDLHVVICTRVAHDLVSLARVAGIGTMALSSALLNITAEQIPTYAACWGHEVNPPLARRLYDELGGWLGVLRHALDSADAQRDPLGTDAAARYLIDHVHPQVSDVTMLTAAMVVAATGHATERLLQAVFRPGTPAEELLGPRSVRELIDELTWHGLLEPVQSNNGPGWRYPTLLESILTNVLETDHPVVAQHVHEATARWLADQATVHVDGLGGLVVVHARAAGDWELLARMWNDHGLCLTIYHAHHADAAYYDLPDEVIAEYPALALASSVISAIGPESANPHRRLLIRNYGEAGWAMHAARDGSQGSGILDITAQLISARQGGDVSAALHLAAAYADQQLGPHGSQISLLHRAWFKLQWAMTCYAARDTSKAICHLNAAAHDARTVGADAIVSAATAQLALVNAFAGYNAAAADHLANHHLVHTDTPWLHHPVRAAGRAAQGILHLDQLDPVAATAQFDIVGADHLEEWALVAWS
ncbi:MAG: hypothetical protein L0G99_06380, partial [Propionibacteriales bacterium]|nr:hypothetical protein [Propionibacteriales bacterium]